LLRGTLWRRNIILHHLHGKTWSPFPVAPEIFKAFESIAAKCADMGHLVEEAAPKYDYDKFRKAFLDMFALNKAREAQVWAKGTEREISRDYLEPKSL